MKEVIARVKYWYKNLPDKKKYIEFVTAILSVPVMITVIILNLNNLNQSKKQSQSGSITPVQIVITGESKTNNSLSPTSNAAQPTISLSPAPLLSPTQGLCKKAVGPVNISSPQEGEVVSTNPVCISISTQPDYCSVTWSYSINGANWSPYTNNDICFYNMSSGTKQLQIRVRSEVTGEMITLLRNFVYQNPNTNPSPTIASSSAGM